MHPNILIFRVSRRQRDKCRVKLPSSVFLQGCHTQCLGTRQTHGDRAVGERVEEGNRPPVYFSKNMSKSFISSKRPYITSLPNLPLRFLDFPTALDNRQPTPISRNFSVFSSFFSYFRSFKQDLTRVDFTTWLVWPHFWSKVLHSMPIVDFYKKMDPKNHFNVSENDFNLHIED